MTAVWYVAAAVTAMCGLWLAGCAIAGLARAIVRAVRRYAAWLRTLPTAGETQAVQEAPTRYRPPTVQGRIRLSRAAYAHRYHEITSQLTDMPTWAQVADIYLIPDQPEETS